MKTSRLQVVMEKHLIEAAGLSLSRALELVSTIQVSGMAVLEEWGADDKN
ncbi:hypothetical protein [Enterococcus sp. AZ109]